MSPMHRRTVAPVAAMLTAFALVVGILFATSSPARASLTESDSFEGWTTNVSGTPDFVVSADTAVSHDGATAARVEYASPYSNSYVDLRQNIRATGGTTYAMSAWVKTKDLSSSGAAYFVLSGDHSQRVELPAGTNDWTKLEWTYTQPLGSMTFVMRLLVRGVGTVWIDDVRMTAPASQANLVINPSFEEHDPPPGTLAFTDTALVYGVGDADIGVTTLASSVTWDVRASSGQRVDSGAEVVANGEASIDLTALPAGYYSVTMSVTAPVAATRTATLAIVEEAAEAASADHPVGLAVHVNRYSVDQVDSLMGPLSAGTLREGPSWDTIETSPGVYQFPAHFDAQLAAAKARGERPLVILAYFSRWYDGGKTPSSPEGIAAFANYAAAAAAHYGSDVDYEIYNEFNHTFNNGACGMTAACYMDLLVPAAAAIHAAAPGARVVGPVSAGAKWDFMEDLFALGALEHLDVVSYHTYDFPVAPEGRTEAGVGTLRALIEQYAPGSRIPIWLSEHGWTTTTGGTTELQQAAYIVRSAALLEAAGVDRVVYYELIDSGANPAEQEHNFGISRLPTDGGTALTPKPAYPALAVFNRLTAGRELSGLQRLDGAIVAEYTDAAGDVLRMMWATGDSVTLAADTGSTARLVKGDGRSWRAQPNGRVEVTVGANPVYLTGTLATPTRVADPAVHIDTPDRVPLDGAPSVGVTVDRATLGVTGDVSVFGPVGAGTTLTGAAAEAAGAVTLASMRELGPHPVAYTVRSGDAVIAFVDDITTVVENPVLSLGPVADEEGAALALNVQNLAGAPTAEVGDIAWTVGSVSGTQPAVQVAGGDTAALQLDLGDVATWQPYPFTVTASAGSKERKLAGTTALAPIAAAPSDGTPVQWRERGTYVPLSGAVATADDLGGTFTVSWSEDGLRVRADVQDQDHTAAATIDRLWAGDSLQFAVARGLPGADPASRVELGAYLGADGAGVYRYTAPVGVVDAAAAITRDGTTTSYDLTVPWDVLGVDPADGAFSFSILVNDNDGGIREGFYEWGSGIGSGKNAALFLPVVPVAPVPPAQATGIEVDGRPLDGFAPERTAYEASALAGGPLPVITATAGDGIRLEVTQPADAPGTATVVASADGRPSTTYTIAIERVRGDDAAVEASVTARCVGDRVQYLVSVRNTSEFASDLRATSSFADEKRSGVPAHATRVIELRSAQTTTDAGHVRVAAYVPYLAPDRAASYTSVDLPVPTRDCTVSNASSDEQGDLE
ncbi:hypothetical protein [Microbacterium trichothecenolyticum]|uniref:Carbohydrate binding protein with CBM9 domain n=1 Tax=Microbacterium trichothecenolyticum TaxID=69370 RepID=A0A0M2HD65_MICTR|nr:hypothetical protein [Microbacterium trichothecenolyticum]KJL44492.1 hypothetical protein RS82_00886 [Microbacterium trichothecenolyticum]